MEFNSKSTRLLEKMFDAALKEQINQLARKYDYGLVFELWARIAKTGCIKNYFKKARWKPTMTIIEALEYLDDYCAGLEALLQKRQTTGTADNKRINIFNNN